MRLVTPLFISLFAMPSTLGACEQPGSDGTYGWHVERETLATEASPSLTLEVADLAAREARLPRAPQLPTEVPVPTERPVEELELAAPGECTGALPWLDAPPTVTDLTPPGLSPFDHLGMRVAISGPWLVAGVDGDDRASLDAGAVRVWRRDAEGWTPSATLTPSRTAPEEHFGWDVAVQRDRVAVAVPGAVVDGAVDAGAVQIFGWDAGAGWVSSQRLVAPTPSVGARFGEAIRLGPERLVAGAPGELDERGSVYVFFADDAGLTVDARLSAPDSLPGDELGASVALFGDLVAVGAPGVHAGDGAAFVARRTASGWGALERLVPQDLSEGARFGGAVAVARDLVLVGADQDSPGGLTEAGSVTVFAHVSGAWRVRTRLLDLIPAPGAHFGGAIAFDGALAAVGAWSADGHGAQTGAVMLFAPAKGGWARLVRLSDPAGAAGDRLGVGVAVGDGVVAAGAWSADGVAVDGGRLLVFEYGACDPTEAPAARE